MFKEIKCSILAILLISSTAFIAGSIIEGYIDADNNLRWLDRHEDKRCYVVINLAQKYNPIYRISKKISCIIFRRFDQ